MKYCFGIDVGGTTVKLGLFLEDGTLIDKWEIPSKVENEGIQILPDIAASVKAKLVERAIAVEDVIGLGVGVPAPVGADGFVARTANLGWIDRPVKAELQEFTGFPVAVGNDANVAALGEMWAGAGKGHADMVMVTLGTGVGGGIIIGGKPVGGAHGAGGEIGHIHMRDDETDSCGCGRQGCLEQYASATGIVRLAKKYLAEHDTDSTLRTEEVTAKAVFDAAKAGDAAALAIAEQFGHYLGTALTNLAAIVDPSAFVIGGGVSKAGDFLLDIVKKYFYENAFYANKETEITLATLGNDAGIYGAAKLILG